MRFAPHPDLNYHKHTELVKKIATALLSDGSVVLLPFMVAA